MKTILTFIEMIYVKSFITIIITIIIMSRQLDFTFYR